MPQLDRLRIEVPCPICGLLTWVTLGEVRMRDFAVCRGCHSTLLLEDYLGNVHRFVRGTERLIRGWSR